MSEIECKHCGDSINADNNAGICSCEEEGIFLCQYCTFTCDCCGKIECEGCVTGHSCDICYDFVCEECQNPNTCICCGKFGFCENCLKDKHCNNCSITVCICGDCESYILECPECDEKF